MTTLVGFVVAAFTAMVLTLAVRAAATRLGWVDAPNADRKWHLVPTPCVGGLAIYLAIVVTIGLIAAIQAIAVTGQGSHLATIIPILGLSSLMLSVGIYDDVKGLTPHTKLALQSGVALLAWVLDFRVLESWSYDGSGLSFGALSLPVTILWIVVITNAFNLIDGLDGLAAGTALFATMSLLCASMVTSQPDAVLLLAVLAGATAGFLRYNFSPASIFLGDSGSLLLGFMLALLSIQTAQKSATAFAVTVPVFAFALPMLDTTLVIIRRFLSRQPIFVGDRRHLHHALLERGFSPKSAVILLYAIAGLLGLVSLLFLNPAGKTMGLAFAMLGVCVVVGIQRLRIPELRALHVYMSRHLRHQRELVASSVAMRQAMDHFDTASSSQELFASLEGALQQSTFSRAVLRLRDGLAATNARNVPGSASEDQTWIWTRQNSRPVGAEWQMVFPLHVGTLTLYHEQNAEYPVSAICWLGQGMTLELERAWHRVQASQARQHAVLRPSSRRPRTVMPALARRNRWPAAQTDAPANA